MTKDNGGVLHGRGSSFHAHSLDTYRAQHAQDDTVPERLLAYLDSHKNKPKYLPMLWACVRALRVTEVEASQIQVSVWWWGVHWA